jgi:hypothetical protein
MSAPNWKPGHPTANGIYWLSVSPENREPVHWEDQKLPSVWIVLVTDRTKAGGVTLGSWLPWRKLASNPPGRKMRN